MRIGPGGNNRKNTPIADVTPRLSIFALNRAGLIAETQTAWQWQTGAAALPLTALARAEPTRLCIALNGGPEVVVQIDRVPGNLGGDYPLFVCECGRRTHYLYLPHFRCRRCMRLDYESRHRTARGNSAIRRALRLRKRLGAEPRIGALLPPRPRWPTSRRYDRIVVEIIVQEARVRANLARMIDAVAHHKR